MNLKEIIYALKSMQEVSHTTLNPDGPGAVRIHLIPPKINFFKKIPSTVILNGKDIIPINMSWAILLNSFIIEVNKYSGMEITEQGLDEVIYNTLERVNLIYPRTKKDKLKEDLWRIVEALCEIAYGRLPNEEIGYMTIGEYAPFMKAPHRMDLMISAMYNKKRKWQCNQKCIHCYAADQEESYVEELSTEDWKKVIDICRNNCIPQLTFTGGEPTLRKDLVELIEYSRWFVTRLNTNGVVLTKELCKQLFEASLDSVQVTLYSSYKDKHNFLVGSDNFDKTVQGIKNAVEAGLNVSVNTPLCSKNKEYVELLEFVNKLGVKYVTCSGLIVTGNAKKDESMTTQLNSKELNSILYFATKYCAISKMEIDFTSPGWLSERLLTELGLNVPSCGACLSNMGIAPNGDVIPCQSWLSKEGVLGNILTTPWKKIWNSEKCIDIREDSANIQGKCPLKEERK